MTSKTATKTNPSKAGKNSQGKPPTQPAKTGKKPRGEGVRFRRNNPITGERDERINRTGQNAKFTEFRHMVNSIFDEIQEYEKGSGEKAKKVKMSQLEFMMRDWIQSKDYQKQNRALEYAKGKVPDEMRIHSSEVEEFIKSNLDLFTDGQLSRLQTGENPLDILGELLRDLKQNQA